MLSVPLILCGGMSLSLFPSTACPKFVLNIRIFVTCSGELLLSQTKVTLLLNSSPSQKPNVVAVSQKYKASISSSPQSVSSLPMYECYIDILYDLRSVGVPPGI